MQLQTDKQQKELKAHGNFAFPVSVSKEVLSHYERGSFLWHWHPEIELTFITEGEMMYQVNQNTYHLKKGDGLFCNSNALHTGHMIDNRDCNYTSITFHPCMIYGYEGSILHTNYSTPLLNSATFSSIPLHSDNAWQQNMLSKMYDISSLFFEKDQFFELQIQQKLSSLWLLILQNVNDELPVTNHENRDIERLRIILMYLQNHYMDKLTLEEIADEIGLCKSECCRFFKKHMHQSLFDYVLEYRIEKSLPLLSQKKYSITEIAEQTGFTSSSYYARIFKKQLGCSPSQYQKTL